MPATSFSMAVVTAPEPAVPMVPALRVLGLAFASATSSFTEFAASAGLAIRMSELELICETPVRSRSVS